MNATATDPVVSAAPPDNPPYWVPFDLIGGVPLPGEQAHPAHTVQLAIRALVASLVFAALYGAAVACTDPMQIVHNVIALPVIVVLAMVCALPPGLLMWKVTGATARVADLVVSVCTGVFTGTLFLACISPLLALYYLTTDFIGAPLAMGMVSVAMGLGIGNAFRAGLLRRGDATISAVMVPLSTALVVLLLAQIQLIHLAAPILPEDTPFDHGIEWFVR